MRRPHITRRAALAFAGLQRATDLLASAFAGRNFATDAGTILTVSPSKAARMRGTAEGPRHAIAAREGIGMRATTRDHALHVGMATFLVIVAFLTPSAKAAAASTGDATSALQTVDCSTGNLILPTASSVTDDGWVRLEYDIDGVSNVREIPPASFRSNEASDQVVARHHLPARPAAGSDATAWASFVDGLGAVRTQGICLPKTTVVGTQRYGQSWGGDEVRFQSSYGFNGVKANYIQASVGTACNSLGDVSEWVGIGGDINESGNSSTSLAQAGTDAWGSQWNGTMPAGRAKTTFLPQAKLVGLLGVLRLTFLSFFACYGR